MYMTDFWDSQLQHGVSTRFWGIYYLRRALPCILFWQEYIYLGQSFSLFVNIIRQDVRGSLGVRMEMGAELRNPSHWKSDIVQSMQLSRLALASITSVTPDIALPCLDSSLHPGRLRSSGLVFSSPWTIQPP